MHLITAGIANINTSVGALQSNTDKVIDRTREFAAKKCTLACFSEQVISGYPAEDLVLWKGFVDEQWQQLDRIKKLTAELEHPLVVVLGLTVLYDGANYNCAAVLQKGKVLGIVPKEQLPTYEVFYEKRVYSPGVPGHVGAVGTIPFGDIFFRFSFGTLAVEVCEDLWDKRGPLTRRALSGAELVVNISASPWRAGIVDARRELIRQRSQDYEVSIIYVNQIGGQDSLVFDGGCVVGHKGEIVHESPRWQENAAVFSIDLADVRQRRKENQAWIQKRDEWIRNQIPYQVIESEEKIPLPAFRDREVAASNRGVSRHEGDTNRDLPVADSRTALFEDQIAAMKLGLKDYFEKTGAFKKIGVAMSGGKDSALTLILAWLYAKERFPNPADIKEFIQAFSMPTRYNSSETRHIARTLSEELGVGFTELSIEEAFAREEAATRAMLGNTTLDRLTLQNIQARLRGMRMWNWANAAQGLWLQSGNMSEKAVG
ncbi:NAD(+) synthase, partial [bacterium]|nr:NAD(+) synthase [bacterium]